MSRITDSKNGLGEGRAEELCERQTVQKRNAIVLYLAVLLTGSCGLAYEYTLSKLASDLLGNSTRQWALIIGVMMFFMGLGANSQRALPSQRLFGAFVLLEALLSLLGGLSSLVLVWIYAYWQSHYVLWQYLLIGAIGFLIGLEIPIITRINESFTPELKVNIGRTLQMDYVGALGGALLWSYWLIPYLPLSRAAAILGLANMLVTCVFFACFYRQIRSRILMFGSISFVLAALVAAFVWGPEWSLRSEQGLYRDPIILRKTTAYQHLVLTRSVRARPAYFPFDIKGAKDVMEEDEAGREYRLYINGHLQFSSRDEFIYHENLVHPAFAVFYERSARWPARVLILGGGDGLALREVRKYASVQEAIIADIDKEMLRLAAENPILRRLNQDALHGANVELKSARWSSQAEQLEEQVAVPHLAGRGAIVPERMYSVQVVLKSIDAVRYVAEADGLFDVIIADFPDPNSEALSRLYSLPFYQNVRRKLGIDGVFVQQSTSPVYAYKAFWAIGRTMMAAGLEALPYHDLVPSFGEWGWWLAVPFHSVEPLLLTLKAHYRQSILAPGKTRYLNDEMMQANILFPAGFHTMYQESLRLLFPNGEAELDLGEFYRDWVTSYTQGRVYQYYLEAAWQ